MHDFRLLIKQICVRSGSHERDLVGNDAVNQEPVGSDTKFPEVLPSAAQLMIAKSRADGASLPRTPRPSHGGGVRHAKIERQTALPYDLPIEERDGGRSRQPESLQHRLAAVQSACRALTNRSRMSIARRSGCSFPPLHCQTARVDSKEPNPHTRSRSPP